MAIDQRDAVTLSLEGPQVQRRWTVALRIFLAFPHFLWFALVGLVATFAVFFAWCAALVIGRMPTGLGGFIDRVVRYQARISAYMYLLTDVYPPFSLDADDYAVELHIEQPDRLNRAAVLFRLILMIPAWIVSSVVTGGATVVLFFLWIITLVSGRMPDSAFEALAVTLRYQMRVYAYAWMLTSRYPGGVFGDKEGATSSAFDDVDALPPVPESLAGRPRITRLVLSKAAKRLVVLFIVLGIVTNVGTSRRTFEVFDRSNAAGRLRTEHQQLEAAFSTFFVDVQTCAASGDLSCVRGANGRLITALRDFQRDLRDIDVSSSADDEVAAVDADATEMITIIDQMQEASDVTAYQQAATRLGEVGSRFDADYERLYDEVRFG
jgi:hypothetical protein